MNVLLAYLLSDRLPSTWLTTTTLMMPNLFCSYYMVKKVRSTKETKDSVTFFMMIISSMLTRSMLIRKSNH